MFSHIIARQTGYFNEDSVNYTSIFYDETNGNAIFVKEEYSIQVPLNRRLDKIRRTATDPSLQLLWVCGILCMQLQKSIYMGENI